MSRILSATLFVPPPALAAFGSSRVAGGGDAVDLLFCISRILSATLLAPLVLEVGTGVGTGGEGASIRHE